MHFFKYTYLYCSNAQLCLALVIYINICIHIWLQYSASATCVFQTPYT